MPGARARAATVAALLTLSLCIPGVAGAAGAPGGGAAGTPAAAPGDPGASLASRIASVTRIVVAADARLERIVAAYPPNPCAIVTEPTAQCDAAVAVLGGYAAIGESVALACGAPALRAAGRPSTATDAGVAAGGPGATALARRLAAIARVLRGADARLDAVLPPGPVSPGSPQAAALDALSRAAYAGGTTAASWIGGAFAWPPNPCARAGG